MQAIQRNAYPAIESLTEDFANYTANILSSALTRQNTVSLVVPGGSTPRNYLPALAAKNLPWQQIYVTLSDDRWVDTESNDSNEYLVKTCWLNHLKTQPHFIGLKTCHDRPEASISEVCQRLNVITQPFTLTILGLGEDGHIASLFPGLKLHETIDEATEQCIAVAPPIAPSLRISLSLSMLAGSERIALVVTGKNKRRLLDKLDHHPDAKIPLIWLLQRAQSPITVFETD